MTKNQCELEKGIGREMMVLSEEISWCAERQANWCDETKANWWDEETSCLDWPNTENYLY